MYIRKRKAFYELVTSLRKIAAFPDRVDLVKDFNFKILELVVDAEKAIKKHKSNQKIARIKLKTGRNTKQISKSLRTKIKKISNYIDAQRDQIYIWKCFGDSLAFVYLDSFSVKQVYYDTDDYSIKQDAGALLGKKGLSNEIGVLLEIIDDGVPAILCDLTNCLRFGDICLLDNPDPFLIEVKSSPKINNRGARQLEKLKKLDGFFVNDVAGDFRGQPGTTMRMSTINEPTYNLKALNTCLKLASEEGYAVIKPENGVTYLAVHEKGNIIDALKQVTAKIFVFYDLNAVKNEHGWSPFTPFLLSIEDAKQILDFIEGRLYLLVFVEQDELCKLLKTDEWLVRYRQGDDYSIQCLHLETSAFMGISKHFISRAAFEFMSLLSISEIHKPSFEKMVNTAKKNGIEMTEIEYQEFIIEKFGPDDEWSKLFEKSK